MDDQEQEPETVTPLPYKGYSPTVDRVIQALDSTRPEDLRLKTCTRCNEANPIFSKANLYDCRGCDNSSIDVDLGWG